MSPPLGVGDAQARRQRGNALALTLTRNVNEVYSSEFRTYRLLGGSNELFQTNLHCGTIDRFSNAFL